VKNWLFLVPIGTDWYRFFFDWYRASIGLSTDVPILIAIMIEKVISSSIYTGQ
jgi:hypothetical protein